MKPATLAIAILALAVTSCQRAPVADPDKPESYAVQIPFVPAAGGSLQRLALPAAALAAIKRADLGDVRVFDGKDRLVPLALLGDAWAGAQHSTVVPVYPIVGPAHALGHSALSIRVEGDSPGKVVTVDTAGSVPDSGTPSADVLLDTHDVQEPANAIVLDIDVPKGQTVSLTLLSSVNLKQWDQLAEKVLFRPANGAPLLGGGKVALSGVDLHGRYVGVSWGGAAGVSLSGASVVTSPVASPAWVAIGTAGATLANPHELRFELHDIARLSAIHLTEAGPDGVIPLKLYGREQADDPWTPLSTGTLQSGPRGASLDLPGPAMTSFRLEADSRTAGFSAVPKLDLLFEQVELLVALSGTPPYRLAVGQASAPAGYLSLSDISPQGTPPRLAELPQVHLPAPDRAPFSLALQVEAEARASGQRKLLLWAALLLGTLVLAFATFRLSRGLFRSDAGAD